MQARILNKEEENLWADFVQNHPLSTIHQTPEWGHFQEKVAGRGKYWIIGMQGTIEQDKITHPNGYPCIPQPPSFLTGGTLLIRHSLPKGHCWLYAPRGPLLDYEKPETLDQQMQILFEEIKKIAQQEKAVFLRIDPPIIQDALTKLEKEPSLTLRSEEENNSKISQSLVLPFKNFHFTKSGFQPNDTLIVDLTKSSDEILTQMKPKGRYNIKLAEKKGVQILKSDPKNPEQFQKDLQDFYQILTETTSRDGFHGHDLDYYKNMLETLKGTEKSDTAVPASGVGDTFSHAQLYLAKYNGQHATKSHSESEAVPASGVDERNERSENTTLAAAIVTYHKDTATYYYGASSNQNRELMAPYLLHWQIMQEAKQNGYKFYDFFGISTVEAKNHPWASVSEFKRKFGGTEISYQPAQEYSFKKLLHLGYQLYKKCR